MAAGDNKLNLTKMVASGLFLLLFGAGIGYLDKINKQQIAKQGSELADDSVAQASFWVSQPDNLSTEAQAAQPDLMRGQGQEDYSFYSRLPEFNVIVPLPPADPVQKAVSAPAESASRPERIVQQRAPEPVAAAPQARPEPEPARVSPQPAAQPAPQPQAAPEPSTTVAARTAPPPTPQPSRPAAVNTQPQRMYVQAGSFSRQVDAVARAQELRGLGIPSVILKTLVDGNDFFRVRVGPIDEAAILDEVRNRLYSRSIDHMVMR